MYRKKKAKLVQIKCERCYQIVKAEAWKTMCKSCWSAMQKDKDEANDPGSTKHKEQTCGCGYKYVGPYWMTMCKKCFAKKMNADKPQKLKKNICEACYTEFEGAAFKTHCPDCYKGMMRESSYTKLGDRFE